MEPNRHTARKPESEHVSCKNRTANPLTTIVLVREGSKNEDGLRFRVIRTQQFYHEIYITKSQK